MRRLRLELALENDHFIKGKVVENPMSLMNPYRHFIKGKMAKNRISWDPKLTKGSFIKGKTPKNLIIHEITRTNCFTG